MNYYILQLALALLLTSCSSRSIDNQTTLDDHEWSGNLWGKFTHLEATQCDDMFVNLSENSFTLATNGNETYVEYLETAKFVSDEVGEIYVGQQEYDGQGTNLVMTYLAKERDIDPAYKADGAIRLKMYSNLPGRVSDQDIWRLNEQDAKIDWIIYPCDNLSRNF